MALKPKITLTGLSDIGNSFILTDLTGVYNVTTNPGGYGAPNIATSDVAAVLIELFMEGSELERLAYIPVSFAPFIAGTPQTISVSTFGETGYFTNGVVHIKYSVLTALVTLTSKSTDLKTINSSAGFRGNEDVVVIGSRSYKVDTTASNTPSSLRLLEAVPSDTLSILPGYFGDQTILNTKQLESNLAKTIGVYAGKPDCACKSKEILFLTDILLRQIGVGVRYSCKDYSGAQMITTAAINDLGRGCKC